MAHISEHARLSSYPYSTISDEANRSLCLMNLKARITDLTKQGKFLYFSSGFASPERSQVLPELSTTSKHLGDGRLTPGEAFAVQALGQEIHYFANRVGDSVSSDNHIHKRVREELKLSSDEGLGLIDFAEGMTMFGSELLNVLDLREAILQKSRSKQIPPLLLERYKTALDLNQNVIKVQVISSIIDITNEMVEKNIESSYHLSGAELGNERDDLLLKIKSRQQGIEFAAKIYQQVLNIAFNENIPLFFEKKSFVKRMLSNLKKN